MNKLGYSPLQLVTGKAVTIPELTTGNLATESMTDSEAVQKTMENLTRIIAEFREADMCQTLKACQKFRMQAYQHLPFQLEAQSYFFQIERICPHPL